MLICADYLGWSGLAYTAPHDPLMAWPEDILKYRGWYDEGYELT